MYEEELKRLWEKLEVCGENLSSEITKFSYALNGVLAVTDKNNDLESFKVELERINILCYYEPNRYIVKIHMPSFFSLEYGGNFEFNMSLNEKIHRRAIRIYLMLQDFEDALIRAEARYFPKDASSASHNGLAKNLLVALRDFKVALLMYADDVY